MKHTTYVIEIVVDNADILEAIYSASAWHCLVYKQAPRLTPDQERLCMMRVKEGYDDLYCRVLGYTSLANFNPNAESGNVRFAFVFSHPCGPTVPQGLKQLVTQLLANFALKRFYGDQVSYYGAAWLKYRAQLLLAFARDDNGLPVDALPA